MRSFYNDKLQWPIKFVYYFISFNIAYDFIGIFNPGRNSLMSLIRGGIIISILIVPYLIKIRFNKISKAVLLFVLYVSFLFPFVTDFSYSFNVSVKVFIPLLSLAIGFDYINSSNRFRILVKQIFTIYVLLTIGFLLNNLLNLGGFTYSEDVDIQFGGFSDNWNVITYSLLIAPLYFTHFKDKKNKILIFKILLVILIILLLISFKRIAIVGLVFGFIIFTYKYYKRKMVLKLTKIIFGLTIVLLILSPIYKDILFAQSEARSDKLTVESLEEENRYRETIVIWSEIFSFESLSKSLFGLEAFASKGHYGQEGKIRFGTTRMSHVDYNLILLTCGIVGLILYLRIYVVLFSYFKKLDRYLKGNYEKLLKAVFLSLFFTSLFTSFGGQMYLITFRSIIFLYMGAILGVLKNIYINKYYQHKSK